MSTGIAPQLDDEVAEAVHDKRVLVEAGRGLDVADSAEPFGDAIEFTKLLFQRGQGGKRRESGRLVALLDRQIIA